jgi:hypothetical protein
LIIHITFNQASVLHFIRHFSSPTKDHIEPYHPNIPALSSDA